MLNLISRFVTGLSASTIIAISLFFAGVTAGYKTKSYLVQKNEIHQLEDQLKRVKENMLVVQKYATDTRLKELNVQKELETLQNEAEKDKTVIATDCVSVSGVRRLNRVK